MISNSVRNSNKSLFGFHPKYKHILNNFGNSAPLPIKASLGLGIILVLDRLPEAKALRENINEIGLRNAAGDFMGMYRGTGLIRMKISQG